MSLTTVVRGMGMGACYGWVGGIALPSTMFCREDIAAISSTCQGDIVFLCSGGQVTYCLCLEVSVSLRHHQVGVTIFAQFAAKDGCLN